MSAPDSYDICRRCYTRLGEGDDRDTENGALCADCKERVEKVCSVCGKVDYELGGNLLHKSYG